MLAMIYARSLNHCIGAKGRIPWHLPEDFAHFKRTTIGAPIIMGRKTYEDHESALPGRLNIVVSRQPDYQPVAGIEVCASLEQAVELAERHNLSRDNNKVFIIGGVEFFSRAYEICDVVYETVVDANIKGDAFLPEFDYSDWHTELLDSQPIDERHQFAFTVYRHIRESAL